MRRLAVVLAFVSALAAHSLGAHAQDQETPDSPKPDAPQPDTPKPDPDWDARRLPIAPLATAKKGDWSILVRKRTAVKQPVSWEVERASVASVEAGKVVVKTFGRVLGSDDKPHEEETPSDAAAEPVIDLFATWSQELRPLFQPSVKVEDAKRTVSGREFSGKRVTARLSGATRDVAEWAEDAFFVTSDVKVRGVVAYRRVSGQREKVSPIVDEVVAGFGTADKTEWGRTLEELSKDPKATIASIEKELAAGDPKPAGGK